MYCPGCGSQRAVSALLHGDIRGAFGYNALAMLASPFLLYAAGVFTHNAIFQKIQQKFFIQRHL